MVSLDDALRELAKLARERQLIRTAQCSEVMKERMLKFVDDKQAKLEADIAAQQAPKGAK